MSQALSPLLGLNGRKLLQNKITLHIVCIRIALDVYVTDKQNNCLVLVLDNSAGTR